MSLFSSRGAVFGALAIAVLALAGCGYRPLYGTASATPNVENNLARIEIKHIPDRSGQMMRTALERRLTPRGFSGAPDYQLAVGLSESIGEIATARTGFSTRANLSLSASYALTTPDGAQAAHGSVRTVASYNVLDSDFATVSARNDARERAVEILADDLRNRLAIYLHGPAKTAPAAGPALKGSTYP